MTELGGVGVGVASHSPRKPMTRWREHRVANNSESEIEAPPRPLWSEGVPLLGGI